jgi:hypothetical protein
MDYTKDQFISEAKKYPVVMRLDTLFVPVDVPAFIAAASIAGVIIKTITMWPHDYQGTRVMVLSGITWDAFAQTVPFHNVN